MYRWVDHTAEVELHIEARTRDEVFADALEAFADLVSRDGEGERAEHDVEVEGRDDASLLVAWLEELVFLVETDDFVPEHMERLELTEGGLSASVSGRRGRPAHLVKAVTYHGLEFVQQGGLWRVKVVLDV
jgi:SHS2 domain-containing protein